MSVRARQDKALSEKNRKSLVSFCFSVYLNLFSSSNSSYIT